MIFHQDTFTDPGGEAILLIRQFKNKEAAINHVKWIVKHCVEKEATKKFWLGVIGELRKY